MNALAEWHRSRAEGRGETAGRVIAPDPEYRLPAGPMPIREPTASGCWSCRRSMAFLRRLGHGPGCTFVHRRGVE